MVSDASHTDIETVSCISRVGSLRKIPALTEHGLGQGSPSAVIVTDLSAQRIVIALPSNQKVIGISSSSVARILFMVFLVLFVVSLIGGIARRV